MKKYKFTYENSGVNINAADDFVKYLANLSNKKKKTLITIILGALRLLITYQEVLKNLY